MSNQGSPEARALRVAFGPGKDCPPIERLQILLDSTAAPAELTSHLEACAYCRTELHLLRRFEAADLDESERGAVEQITEQLRVVHPRPQTRGAVVSSHLPWWKPFLTARWLSPAALAVATVLIILAVGLQWRRSQPVLHAPAGQDGEVLRSNAIDVLSPTGDIRQIPKEIQWQAAPVAVRYEVRLLEVDGTPVWTASTTGSSIELPPAARARIVPAKTLLWQISGFDATGHLVAESGTVRFRLLQNVYTP